VRAEYRQLPMAVSGCIDHACIQEAVRGLRSYAAIRILALKLGARGAEHIVVHPAVVSTNQQAAAAAELNPTAHAKGIARLWREGKGRAWLQASAIRRRVSDLQILRVEQAERKIQLPPLARRVLQVELET